MEKEKINLLIVDDEEQFLASITKSLELRDFNVIAVNRGEKAIEAAKNNPIDIALVDLKMPGISGEETLKLLKQEHKWMEVVILTGHGAVDSAVECTKSGAYSYLQKPCELNSLLSALQDAYKMKVMNKKKIEEKKMNELLNISFSSSPREILRKLREMDQGD
ncbi:MAG: response regulator [Desulfobacula sp.]|uniref:response regulator n=1 Tax=Desulfobacula sp. TaxID=2593537 RepID=UPI0025C34702|nr:response regulator [Desulfobacula sp.]MCD4719619.1 response regulator [Desulfobacula sp.]